MGNFRTAFYCLIGVSIVAAILNVLSLHVWESKSTSGEKLSPDSYKVPKPRMKSASAPKKIKRPTVLWWTDFTLDTGSVKRCGDVSCFFTNNRSYLNDPSTQMIMFYGASLEYHDLPLPRQPHHQWGIIHEESPKNNWAFCNEKFMSLFNYTATFQRTSDFPLTLIWLSSIQDIESQKYYYTAEEKNWFMKKLDLAPIAYIHSDCGTPSDRDQLMKLLSKHIKIDSLGQCLNNKKLPKHLDGLGGMDHDDFYALLSKYKFVFAAENAVCDDYITEKFWRSFYVGTVPIVYGSPSIKDWLPTPQSAIVVQDHQTIKSLASAIQRLHHNDSAYNFATNYKVSGVKNSRLIKALNSRTWAVKPKQGEMNFVDACECYFCGQLYNKQNHIKRRKRLSCPPPKPISMSDQTEKRTEDFWWPSAYTYELEKGDRAYRNVVSYGDEVKSSWFNVFT